LGTLVAALSHIENQTHVIRVSTSQLQVGKSVRVLTSRNWMNEQTQEFIRRHGDGRMLISLLCGSIPATIVGSLLARRFSSRWLQAALAIVLFAVGIKTLL